MNRIAGVVCMLSVAWWCEPAWALWGKTETKTESRNAEMNLGQYKGLKHAIGCKKFDNEAGWRGSWELGENLAIMLESALYDTGRFVIVEREKLSDVIAEQDLAASGRAAAAKKVAQTGKIRSARYIGTGAVTVAEENQSGGALDNLSFKGIRIGGGKSEAQVTIIAKLIDTTTGEIVAKETIVGKAGRTSARVGLSVSGLNTDVSGFKKTPMGEAAQDAINQAAAFIAKKMESFPFEGSVIKVTDKGQVIINRGSEFGVEVGQELVLATEGEELIDPDTGEILGAEEGEEIGRVRIAKVAEKISYGDIVSGDKNPSPGTVVRAAK